MRKLTTIVVLVIAMFQLAEAQQDAMFTKYMFNTLNYNPAYAGSRGYLSLGALHRTQWWGIEGAPHSQNLWVHSPIKGDKVGLGFGLINDIIGPTNSITANISYAYHLPLKGLNKMSIGIQGGITNWRANWNRLDFESDNYDESYSEDFTPSLWLPNVGMGLYFYNQEKYFVGVGIPHFIESDYRKGDDVTTEMWAKQYRHYYFSAGGAIPLDKSKNFVFRPMALVKTVALFKRFAKKSDDPFGSVGAPTEFDIDLSVFFYHTFWLGVSFRSSIEKFAGQRSSFDSADVWVSYFFKNGLRVGAAYDYTLTKLQQPARGSFEIMLGYDLDFKEKKIVTPRYF